MRFSRKDDSDQATNGPLMARRHAGAGRRRRPSVRNLLPTWAFAVERMTGIEPALSAWEADVLPLNYIRTVRQRFLRCLANTSYRNGVLGWVILRDLRASGGRRTYLSSS
jgi:hypothetical protein